MASISKITQSTAAQVPACIFITGANPKVKLPNFQFGGFDPNSLQFGTIEASSAPVVQELSQDDESFPPLSSVTTAAKLPTKGKRHAVVIPGSTQNLIRKIRNGKGVLKDLTTINRGQPVAVRAPKAATNLDQGRVSVFDRLSYSNEGQSVTHQHHKTNENDFDLKFVPGATSVSKNSRSKSCNERRRAAKKARAAMSATHSVNVISHSLRGERFAVPTYNPFEILESTKSQYRVVKKASLPQSINMTGGKKISTTI